MSALNDLIAQISDEGLRQRIQQEADKLAKQKKFGLVFEEHLPECTPLYDIPVKKGGKVALRDGNVNDTYTVLKIENGTAYCVKKDSNEVKEFAVADLIAVAEFGDPIYPYLKPLDSVCNAPDSDLWHTLIEADNYHALQLLEYLYAGKVDCIYIDPPYNTGAKDWKYNNDYVDGNDQYRHSKWLSMMQKRLALAKKLLNPIDSVLIVTIDDKEYLHLGCLLEEMFTEAKITMISSVINPVGKAKKGGTDFSRTDEYIYFLQFGAAAIQPEIRETSPVGIRWQTFRRSSLANGRGKHGVGACGPNQFYPIYVDDTTHRIVEVGYPIPENVDRFSVKQIPGCSTVFPVRKDGIEINWGATREKVLELLEKGYFKVLPKKVDEPQQYKIKYLTSGVIKDIDQGKITITGNDETGGVVGYYDTGKEMVPTTNWNKASHNATSNGTDLLTSLFCEQRFDYAKSLYAVHDSIRCAVSNKPNALVVDFFAGSGTTLHAVNLLNAEDGGHRRCILVTNNEVSEAEGKELKAKGYKPGDDEWDKLGIAHYVTWPRTVCSIEGHNINGSPLKGDYISTETEESEANRTVTKIGHLHDFGTYSFADQKEIICALSGKTISKSSIKEGDSYAVSDNDVSILWDVTAVDDWLEEMEEYKNINRYLIITDDAKAFKTIKDRIVERFGKTYSKTEMKKMHMADGFKANAAFFKLGFLDKTAVALGMQFKEMIPTLWMKAGAHGKCPENTDIPKDMLILPKNRMAILINENAFSRFEEELRNQPTIDTVFIITDYESNYRAMVKNLNVKETYQLYRDYLDNFRINHGRN